MDVFLAGRSRATSAAADSANFRLPGRALALQTPPKGILSPMNIRSAMAADNTSFTRARRA